MHIFRWEVGLNLNDLPPNNIIFLVSKLNLSADDTVQNCSVYVQKTLSEDI